MLCSAGVLTGGVRHCGQHGYTQSGAEDSAATEVLKESL